MLALLQSQQHERISELDGLRGIAIISVMFFHSSTNIIVIDSSLPTILLFWISSIGWAGVDVFFVLSGFLITSILLRAKDKPNYFRNFYIRRILRIFPLYYVALLLILFVLIPLVDPNNVEQTRSYQFFYYTYLHNWLYALGTPKSSLYLDHFWSLAIEEQFYLLWPLVVYAFQYKRIGAIASALILLLPLYRLAEIILYGPTESTQIYLYYSTFARLDDLMIGVCIALLPHYPRIQAFVYKHARITLMLVSILICVLFFSDPQLPSWKTTPMLVLGFSLIGLVGGASIILARSAPEKSPFRTFLRSTLFVFFGKYSYAMYIFHLPIILLLIHVFARNRIHGFMFVILYLLLVFSLTILAAITSWHMLEKHMLALRQRFV